MSRVLSLDGQRLPTFVLEASERAGGHPSGRIIPMGCLENKVYWVPNCNGVDHVVKIYRRNRWTEAQIDLEHEFLWALQEEQIDVAGPLDLGDGYTFDLLDDTFPSYFCVFPKVDGRMRDEITVAQAEQLGLLLRDVHRVGLRIEDKQERRPKDNLDELRLWMDSTSLPPQYRMRAQRWMERIASATSSQPFQLIHGDCHLGNVIWSGDQPTLIDFDDCGLGWIYQDLWMVAPSGDSFQRQGLQALLSAYDSALSLRELEEVMPVLKALRMLNYARWIHDRYPDPAFVDAYPQFKSASFYSREIEALDKLETELP